MYEFDITRPKTIAQAVEALGNDEAQPLSGGQTFIPTLKARLAAPAVLVSLSGINEMRGICDGADGTVCIGGATPHAQVAREAARYPALAALAGQIGDPAVRNRGTIGGSVANNDPSACYPAAVLASGAFVVTPDRVIGAEDFFLGLFETALGENEIVTEIRFPVPQKAGYAKFKQPASRFALVGVFVAQYADGVRVAVTGASEDGVYRWSDAEAALDQDFTPAALDRITMSHDGMIEDLHADAAYRAHLVGVMARRALGVLV